MTSPAADAAQVSESHLIRQVLSLAWPVLLLQALIVTVEMSDRFLVGTLPQTGAESSKSMLTAQGTANYVAWFITSYTVLVSVGATALVARCIGARDWATANAATHQAILLAICTGIIGTAFGLWILRPVVGLLGLEGSSAEYAVQYLRPMIALLTFRVVEVAGISCLIGAGDTRTGLFVQGGIAILNIILSWLLSRTFGWGFVGVSTGTAISYACGAVAVLAVLFHGRAHLKVSLPGFRPSFPLQWRLLRISLPAALDSLSTVGGQMWFLNIVNHLGETNAAAHGIALGWEALGYLSGHSFGTAATSLVGRSLGAKKPDLAARAGWTAFGLGCGFMSFMGLLFILFAPQMFQIFCHNEDQQDIVAAGVPVLRLVAFAMPTLASTIVFTYCLRGAGDTRVPVMFTWLGFLAVRIPLAHLFTGPRFDLGLYGAWLAMVADLTFRGVVFALRFISGRWKKAVV